MPIYIAALGEKNVAGTAEYADGWLPFLYRPGEGRTTVWGDALARRARPSARPTSARCEICRRRHGRDRRGREGPARLRPAAVRALHRRHGRQGQELLQRRWPASTATRRRPSRSRTSTSAARRARPRRSSRSSCSRCATWSARSPTSRSGSPRSREAGVTNLKVIPGRRRPGRHCRRSSRSGCPDAMRRDHLRGRARGLPRRPSGPSWRRRSSRTTSSGRRTASSAARSGPRPARPGLLCFDVPEEYGGAGVARLPLQHDRGRGADPGRRERPGLPGAHRHHRPLPHHPRHRRAEAALAARPASAARSSPRSR